MSSTATSSRILTAIPGENEPHYFATEFQKKLIESALLYINKVEESFKLDLKPLEEKLESLDCTRRFSPALFVYYSHLKEGYTEKNLQAVFDALQWMKNLREFYAFSFECSTIMSEEWEYMCIEELRRNPMNEHQDGEVEAQLLPLVHWKESDFPPPEMKQALVWMRELDPGLEREKEAYLSKIKLFAGKVLESVTSTSYFGAAFMRLAYPHEEASIFYLRNITHELSHLHLFAMMGLDSFILNSPTELFSSPLRRDKRPMLGIFHATFVLSRMVRVLTRYTKEFPSHTSVEPILKKDREAFLSGLKTVRGEARLTEEGVAILNSLECCAFE